MDGVEAVSLDTAKKKKAIPAGDREFPMDLRSASPISPERLK